MQFLLLLVLMTACSVEWPARFTPAVSAAATAAVVATLVGLQALLGYWARRRLRRGADPDEVAERYHTWRTGHTFLLLAASIAVLAGLGWGEAVRDTCKIYDVLAPGAELLNALPLFAGLILSWAVSYDTERALFVAFHPDGRPFWGRWSYVNFQVRQNIALVLLPVGLFVALQAVRRLAPDLDDSLWFQALGFGGMALGLVSMPLWVRLVFGLRPLPPGPLRDRLQSAARRLDFRCTNILFWPTRGGVANAMVVGVIPWLRYVLLTDRLLNELTPEEVEAVFGHEVGHVKHGHIPYYLAFFLLSLVALGGAYSLAVSYLPESAQRYSAENEGWLMMPVVGLYVFTAFGFLSRRCERQADVYGCRAVSCPHSVCWGHDADTELAPRGRGLCPTGIKTFISALERVADLNGMSRTRPGYLQAWLHGSIAGRIGFLERVLHEPSLERRFQRSIGRLKLVLFIGLILAVGSVMAYEYSDSLKELWVSVSAGVSQTEGQQTSP
jgi:STE24 endopeptidase